MLTAKKAFFVIHYMASRNATQAAVKAGYAKTAAHSLMNDKDIKEELERLIVDQKERMLITADEVISELKKIGFADIRKAFNSDGTIKNIANIPDDLAAAIQSFDYKNGVKLASKTGALELLGKHLKLFTDKHEVSGPGGGAIKTTAMPALTVEELRKLAHDDSIGGTED